MEERPVIFVEVARKLVAMWKDEAAKFEKAAASLPEKAVGPKAELAQAGRVVGSCAKTLEGLCDVAEGIRNVDEGGEKTDG